MLNETKLDAASERLRRAIQGDRESLETLLPSYIGYLKVLSRTQLDKRIQHRVSPSDLVQETLLEAHRDFAKFQGTTIEEFTGWLRRILVHNLAQAVGTHMLAAKRDVRREQVIENFSGAIDRSHLRLSALLFDRRRTPASEADHQESLTRMANALETLPSDYRQVIVLRHLDGLPFRLVAERMQRTPGAARMLWLRAIEQLRLTMAINS
ncbi:RNA polymerase sigma factor RpoE [Novipirellula galeiformis]|uniref:RNA polymerase sigma factor RpoE n=1 Tax=Novipirellula galeiformis TaxID=2528004 RepID=A0A5C6CP30_9BACT|nr:sigma-70 family RNA polymerase sigma factor [Novipirellula galeiformis]TWU25367.1 RNA polymerase sigma factor RpoE [Novipirellula galeiformis]